MLTNLNSSPKLIFNSTSYSTVHKIIFIDRDRETEREGEIYTERGGETEIERKVYEVNFMNLIDCIV